MCRNRSAQDHIMRECKGLFVHCPASGLMLYQVGFVGIWKFQDANLCGCRTWTVVMEWWLTDAAT